MELKPEDIASLPPEQQEQILALVCQCHARAGQSKGVFEHLSEIAYSCSAINLYKAG
jgi:hypothetical protein